MDYDSDSDPGYGPRRLSSKVPWTEYRVVNEGSGLPRVSYESAGYGPQKSNPNQTSDTAAFSIEEYMKAKAADVRERSRKQQQLEAQSQSKPGQAPKGQQRPSTHDKALHTPDEGSKQQSNRLQEQVRSKQVEEERERSRAPRRLSNKIMERARLMWLEEQKKRSGAQQHTPLQENDLSASHELSPSDPDNDSFSGALSSMSTETHQSPIRSNKSPPHRLRSTNNPETLAPQEDMVNPPPSSYRSTSRQEPPPLPRSYTMPIQRLRSRNANNAPSEPEHKSDPREGPGPSIPDTGARGSESRGDVSKDHGERSAEVPSARSDRYHHVSSRPKPLAAYVEDVTESGDEDEAFRTPTPIATSVRKPPPQPTRPQTPLYTPSVPISSTTSTNARDTAVQFHNKGEVTNQVGSNQNVSGSLYFGTVVNNTYHVDSTHEEKPVQALRNSGTSLNAQGGRFGTPLQEASFFGEEGIVRALIGAGADVNAPGGSVGTALQAAALQGHSTIVLALLRAGAHVDAQSGEFCTALQAAAGSDTESADVPPMTMMMLLAAGADVDVVGGKYGTALQAAVCSGRDNAVDLLLKSDADVNARGGVHGTALRAAMSRRNNGRMIQMLLDAGADANA